MRGSLACVLGITLLAAGLSAANPRLNPPPQPKPLVKADPQGEAEAAIRELAGQVQPPSSVATPPSLLP